MHLPRPYCILIGSQLWEFPRPYSWPGLRDNGGWQCMGNYLYTCPVCGEQWAQAWDTSRPVTYWECHTQPCERHELDINVCWSTVPGSLFPGPWGIDGMRDPALFAHLPAELVARELNLHLRRFTTND